MSETATAPEQPADATTAQAPGTLIVFGVDDGGKPHASRFSAVDAELATKAAGLMGMRTFVVETDEHRELAAQLPQGRVFASGRGFVPFVKKGLYEALSALAGPAAAASITTESKPADAALQRPGGNVSTATEVRPIDWDSILVGSTVLVHGGGEDGFFEANIVEVKTANLFVLRWRDWPELPVLVRTKADIALLNPVPTAAQG